MSKSVFNNYLNKVGVIKVHIHNDVEYIQGKLIKVTDKSFTILQIIPFCNYLTDKEYKTLEREVFFDAKYFIVEAFK